jgi:hypothetical protein
MSRAMIGMAFMNISKKDILAFFAVAVLIVGYFIKDGENRSWILWAVAFCVVSWVIWKIERRTGQIHTDSK